VIWFLITGIMPMSGRINVGFGLFLPPGYARAAASSYSVFIALQTRSSSHDRGRIPRRGDYE
jgi:hypothetical protein